MAVNFTTIFTIMGKYIKKLNVDYGYIATLNTDQSDIETVLVAQSVTRLADGLGAMYDGFRGNITTWVQNIITRISGVLTDPALVTDQYAFGANPGIQAVLIRMIKDMSLNDKNVTASAMTTNSITRSVTHSEAGFLVVGTKLDGVTPPMSGAPPVPEYAGLTSLLYPDDETITFTCSQDSENGAQRGGERFAITGTGAGAAPYSVSGENLGSAGTINVADITAANFVTNSSFDNWSGSPSIPTGWTKTFGTVLTDYDQSTPGMYQGSALKLFNTAPADGFLIQQVLNSNSFVRRRAYFISVWAKLSANDGDGTTNATLTIQDDSTVYQELTLNPTSSSVWTLYNGIFVISAEIVGNIRVVVSSPLTATKDAILIDQVVITPATYVAGAAFALFGGKEKFLQGDTLSIRLQNNNAGVIGTYFRKAHRVQLPVDSTPTISDSLAT